MSLIPSISSLALPPWLKVKFIAIWLAGLLVLALAWSWNDRGHEVTRLTDYQTGVVQAVTAATVEPDAKGRRKLLKPEQVVTAIAGLQRSYASAKTAIGTINTNAATAKRRADAQDLTLRGELTSLRQAYTIADTRIRFLQSRPPVKGTELEVCKVIEDDTNSAWNGWKER